MITPSFGGAVELPAAVKSAHCSGLPGGSASPTAMSRRPFSQCVARSRVGVALVESSLDTALEESGGG